VLRPDSFKPFLGQRRPFLSWTNADTPKERKEALLFVGYCCEHHGKRFRSGVLKSVPDARRIVPHIAGTDQNLELPARVVNADHGAFTGQNVRNLLGLIMSMHREFAPHTQRELGKTRLRLRMRLCIQIYLKLTARTEMVLAFREHPQVVSIVRLQKHCLPSFGRGPAARNCQCKAEQRCNSQSYSPNRLALTHRRPISFCALALPRIAWCH